jgi:hypothetical protein
MNKRFMAALIAALVALSITGSLVSAHVHGITPLNGCSVDNFAKSGAKGTDGTPADDANGGPITGLIPRDTGNAPLTVGDGGFGAATGNCP